MKLQEGARAFKQASRKIFATQSNVSRSIWRGMATEAHTSISQHDSQDNTLPATPASTITTDPDRAPIYPLKHIPPPNPFIVPAQCTLYSFPQLEPTGFVSYPSTHLLLPLRRDLLHRAVIYEADGKRQGTASTKWRDDVSGSGRKLRPQKGSGRARIGDKKSPVLRGGGVAFGPHPRDFSTDLPRKIYDLAWRTAFSYRYRRGQLLIVKGVADVADVPLDDRARYIQEMLRWHALGAQDSRTLIVTDVEREAISSGFQESSLSKDGALLTADDVDVKAILKLGRVVIEQSAFERLLREHQSDLAPAQRFFKKAPSLASTIEPATVSASN